MGNIYRTWNMRCKEISKEFMNPALVLRVAWSGGSKYTNCPPSLYLYNLMKSCLHIVFEYIVPDTTHKNTSFFSIHPSEYVSSFSRQRD